MRAALFALLLVSGAVLAHDLDGDPANSAWLRTQVNPTDGGSCCSETDCFETTWRSVGGQIQGALQDGTWVDLPASAKLKTNHYSGLLLCYAYGRVLCWAEGSGT